MAILLFCYWKPQPYADVDLIMNTYQKPIVVLVSLLCLAQTNMTPAFAQYVTPTPERDAALLRIKQQAVAQTERLQDRSLQLQQDVRYTGERGKEIYDKARGELARELESAVVSDGQGGTMPAYSPGAIRYATDPYKEKARIAEESGQRNSCQIGTSYSVREDALADSARNLQEQLIQKPALSDSIELQPVGTNLYVRNYQIVGDQYSHMPAVQPMQAAQQTSVPSHPNAKPGEVQKMVSGRLFAK